MFQLRQADSRHREILPGLRLARQSARSEAEPASNTVGGYANVPAQQAAPASVPVPNPAPRVAPQNGYSYGQSGQNAYGQPGSMPPVRAVGFGEAIANFFKKYAEFSGRATRSEFWFAALFNFLAGFVAAFIPFIGWLYPLAVLVPNLAIAWRRLHDIGKSGTYFLMGLIPLAGPIILLVYYCTDSVGDNEYGRRIV